MKADYKQPTEAKRGPPIAGIRIAKITHEFAQVHPGGTQTIGQIIDEHMARVIGQGEMISEVSLFFETDEQRSAIADMYR